MPADWRASASVWLNDPDRGRVILGPFGFAWWQGRKLFVAQFRNQESSPVSGYKSYEDWAAVKTYTADHVPMPSVVRFVRTGLLPA
jgi:hypothetical protein